MYFQLLCEIQLKMSFGAIPITIAMERKKMSESTRLPESSIPLLRYLQSQGRRTQRELIEELGLPTRTVRYSIRRLLERGLIRKIPNLKDMRSVFYLISPEVADVETIIEQEMAIVN